MPAMGDALNHLLWLAHQNGVDRFFTITDKTYVLWYRLFPILSLAYLLSTCGGGAARLCLSCGRQSAGPYVSSDHAGGPARTYAGDRADPWWAAAAMAACRHPRQAGSEEMANACRKNRAVHAAPAQKPHYYAALAIAA